MGASDIGLAAASAVLHSSVGFDVGVTSERGAELAFASIDDPLARHGCCATWLASHRVVVDDGVHVALSLILEPDPVDNVDLIAVIGEAFGDAELGLADRRGLTGALPRMQAAARARAAVSTRSEGRVVRFPGSSLLLGEQRVADIVDRTAVDRVQALGGTDCGREDLVRTRDFVRPRFVLGELVLHVQPARGGVFVPFETPTPTPCCADHAR